MGQSIATAQTIRDVDDDDDANLSHQKQHLKIHHYHATPFQVPPMTGTYDWSRNIVTLPKPGSGAVLFTTNSTNDVHIAISPHAQSCNPMYEVVVGGWSNTASVVRRSAQGPNLCTVPVGLEKQPGGQESGKELWVSVDRSRKLLRLGRGRVPGFDSMFLVYLDPFFLADVRFVCFSTWDVPATYSDVVVLALDE